MIHDKKIPKIILNDENKRENREKELGQLCLLERGRRKEILFLSSSLVDKTHTF